ncbi:hypothetical protein A9G13_00550 [Gilliamella sp. wkB178]|nr:hypothetical protein A9G13_00550 [Gilliamella apicola]
MLKIVHSIEFNIITNHHPRGWALKILLGNSNHNKENIDFDNDHALYLLAECMVIAFIKILKTEQISEMFLFW